MPRGRFEAVIVKASKEAWNQRTVSCSRRSRHSGAYPVWLIEFSALFLFTIWRSRRRRKELFLWRSIVCKVVSLAIRSPALGGCKLKSLKFAILSLKSSNVIQYSNISSSPPIYWPSHFAVRAPRSPALPPRLKWPVDTLAGFFASALKCFQHLEPPNRVCILITQCFWSNFSAE